MYHFPVVQGGNRANLTHIFLPNVTKHSLHYERQLRILKSFKIV